MNAKQYTLILTTLIGTTLCATAANEGCEKEQFYGKNDLKRKALKRFDTDGDGQFSEAERVSAKTAKERRKSQIDADGDGTISNEEKKTVRNKRRNTIHQRIDSDGDGTISKTEWKAVRRARRKHNAL